MIIKQFLLASFLSLLLLNLADGYSQDDLSDCIPSYRKGYCLHTLKKADSLVDSSTYKEIDPTNANLIDISQMTISQFLYVGKKAYYRNIQKFLVVHDKSKALPSWNNFFADVNAKDDLAFDVNKLKFYKRGANEKFNLFIERKFIGKFTCPKGFLTYHQEVNTTCFRPFTGKFKYQSCLKKCIEYRSQAAVFDTWEQLSFIDKSIEDRSGNAKDFNDNHYMYNGFWIGTRLPDHKGSKYTPADLYNVDGSPVRFYGFADREPNGGLQYDEDERCIQTFFVEFYGYANGQKITFNKDHWNDYFCSEYIYGCLCRTQPDRT